MDERFLRSFELSPDGSFMLVTGTSGYLHLLSMKVASAVGAFPLALLALLESAKQAASQLKQGCDACCGSPQR